jgi:hypothetical protein
LGVSRIHGIGVFAVEPIASGRLLFAADDAEICWIDGARLDKLSVTARAFYNAFAIRKNGQLGCPRSFDLLTPGWYINEPPTGDDANVAVSADWSMIASRDIAIGEELTVRYASFSDA